jgi:hypothetical protein
MVASVFPGSLQEAGEVSVVESQRVTKALATNLHTVVPNQQQS